jgi:general secretion pathway protein G
MFYQYPGRNNEQSGKPDIWSAGPNKQDDQGSGDDVNNWTVRSST